MIHIQKSGYFFIGTKNPDFLIFFRFFLSPLKLAAYLLKHGGKRRLEASDFHTRTQARHYNALFFIEKLHEIPT